MAVDPALAKVTPMAVAHVLAKENLWPQSHSQGDTYGCTDPGQGKIYGRMDFSQGIAYGCKESGQGVTYGRNEVGQGITYGNVDTGQGNAYGRNNLRLLSGAGQGW